MKVSDFDIKTLLKADGTYEIDFIRNKKSMFCMDAVFFPGNVQGYMKQLERFLECREDTEFQMHLAPSWGESVKLIFNNVFREDLFSDVPYGFFTDLVISYPTDKNGCIWYNDRKIRCSKLEFVKAFYEALVSVEPECKSQLIEAVLENGNLDAFYERIC